MYPAKCPVRCLVEWVCRQHGAQVTRSVRHWTEVIRKSAARKSIRAAAVSAVFRVSAREPGAMTGTPAPNLPLAPEQGLFSNRSKDDCRLWRFPPVPLTFAPATSVFAHCVLIGLTGIEPRQSQGAPGPALLGGQNRVAVRGGAFRRPSLSIGGWGSSPSPLVQKPCFACFLYAHRIPGLAKSHLSVPQSED